MRSTRFIKTAAILGAVALALGVGAKQSQAQAFKATVSGAGWLFGFKTSAGAGNFADYTTITDFVLDNLASTGHGWYQLGFDADAGAPPAFITLQEAGLGHAAGDTVQVTNIGSAWLFNTASFSSATPSASGFKLYDTSPNSDTQVTAAQSAGWQTTALASIPSPAGSGAFGYDDSNGRLTGNHFAGTSHFMGNGVIDFGRFDFTTWTPNTGGTTYLAFDVRLNDGNTGRIYVTDSPVPEPIFYQLGALLGMGGLGMMRFRRKAA